MSKTVDLMLGNVRCSRKSSRIATKQSSKWNWIKKWKRIAISKKKSVASVPPPTHKTTYRQHKTTIQIWVWEDLFFYLFLIAFVFNSPSIAIMPLLSPPKRRVALMAIAFFFLFAAYNTAQSTLIFYQYYLCL